MQEEFDEFFEDTLLGPELGTIYGNLLESNDGAKLGIGIWASVGVRADNDDCGGISNGEVNDDGDGVCIANSDSDGDGIVVLII